MKKALLYTLASPVLLVLLCGVLVSSAAAGVAIWIAGDAIVEDFLNKVSRS